MRGIESSIAYPAWISVGRVDIKACSPFLSSVNSSSRVSSISPGEDGYFLIPEVELGVYCLGPANLSTSSRKKNRGPVFSHLCHICGLALLAAIVGLEWERIVE